MESLLIENASQAQAAQAAHNAGSVVEFNPAHIALVGKTSTERRLGVVSQATFAAQAYLSAQKGKVGAAAREGMTATGSLMIAKAVACGNYRPVGEALAVILNKSIHFSTRAAWESFGDVLAGMASDLKGGGYRVSTKTGVEEPTAARKAIDEATNLYRHVGELVKDHIATSQGRRESDHE